jgi:hypothetical protein
MMMQMVALCPDTLAGKRGQALLAFGFAGAFSTIRACRASTWLIWLRRRTGCAC